MVDKNIKSDILLNNMRIKDIFTDDLVTKINRGEVKCSIGQAEYFSVVESITIDYDKIICDINDGEYVEPFIFLGEDEVDKIYSPSKIKLRDNMNDEPVDVCFYITQAYNAVWPVTV